MTALNQKNIAEWSKKLCQKPEVMDSAVSSCQRFSSLHGFKATFLEDWAEIFQWEISILPGTHYHCSSSIFCVSQAGERRCAVSRGTGLCKNLWFSHAHSQSGSPWSLPRSSLFILPQVVLCSYLGVHFKLFFPSFCAQWSLGKSK